MTSPTLRVILIAFFLGAFARPASADWLLTPYLGITFGGNAAFGDVGDVEDNLEKRVAFGGTVAWLGTGTVGFEFDFGSTPNFFEVTGGSGNFDFGDSNLTSLMANLVVASSGVGSAGARVRGYGSGGIGLLRANIGGTTLFDNLSTNELGINLGGGAYVFFNDFVGVRADVRYFRELQQGDDNENDLDLSDFDFWRATFGVTFRFGG